MPPKARLVGLILLLLCPAGLAAQTQISNGISPFSTDPLAGESDLVWVTPRRSVSPSRTTPLLERLDRVRTDSNLFAHGASPNFAGNDSARDDVVAASYTAPAEPSGDTSWVGSSAEPPGKPAVEPLAESSVAEDRPLRVPSSYPPLPPPGSSDFAPTGQSGAQFGGAESLLTMGGSLALVLGLFMALAWIMRRTVPGVVRALPGEVVEVLGRAPLAGRQQVHLVRCGRKLILISVTPEGAETLTEITDAEEVDRLAGLCRETEPGSATNAFRHVFGQLAGQRTGSAIVTEQGDLDLSSMGFVQSAPGGTGEQR